MLHGFLISIENHFTVHLNPYNLGYRHIYAVNERDRNLDIVCIRSPWRGWSWVRNIRLCMRIIIVCIALELMTGRCMLEYLSTDRHDTIDRQGNLSLEVCKEKKHRYSHCHNRGFRLLINVLKTWLLNKEFGANLDSHCVRDGFKSLHTVTPIIPLLCDYELHNTWH